MAAAAGFREHSGGGWPLTPMLFTSPQTISWSLVLDCFVFVPWTSLDSDVLQWRHAIQSMNSSSLLQLPSTLSFSLHELWSWHMKLVIGWTVLMVKMFLVAKWNGLIVAIKCGKLEIPHPTFYLFLSYLHHVNILPFLLSSGRRWKILDNRFCIYQICNLSKI